MEVTFLEAGKPLRKTIHANGDKDSYPNVKRFLSHTKQVDDFKGFTEACMEAAEQGWCLFRGKLVAPLDWESRAGKAVTGDKAVTSWLLLDCDGIHGAPTPDYFLHDVLGFPDGFEYLVHWSSSARVNPEDDCLRCHIFVPLSRECKHTFLRRWLRAVNLMTPLLSDQLRLTADQRTFCWPLDVAVNDAGRLVYIAPPRFVGREDPFDSHEARWELRNEGGGELPIGALKMPSATELMDLQREVLAQKQREAGLRRPTPPKTKVLKSQGTEWELVLNPRPAEVTDTREDREYVRLNINGGDSWAYWHPVGNPRYIYSFKGMLAYEAGKFVPDYARMYREKVAEARRREMEEQAREAQEAYLVAGEPQVLFFTDATTEKYYCGLVTPDTPPTALKEFTRITTVRSWVRQNGGEMDGSDIPVWDVVFEPDQPTFDFENRRVNMFHQREEAADGELPDEMVMKFMLHVMGGDERMLETFLHWLARIYQTSEPAHTAWLLWGVHGTGKDLLCTLARNLLGSGNCRVVPPHLFVEDFNEWALRCVLAVVNETDDRMMDMKKALPKAKDYITASDIRIRVMRKDSFEARNRLNFIFCSNRPNAMYIEPTDRRFHVPPRQEVKLDRVMDPAELVRRLNDREMWKKFRAWLRDLDVDDSLVRKPAVSDAKVMLMHATQTAGERLAVALMAGLWAEILEQLPEEAVVDLVPNRVLQGIGTQDVREAVHGLMAVLQQAAAVGTEVMLDLNQAYLLYSLIVDDRISCSPGKFRQYLLHQGLKLADKPKWCRIRRRQLRGVVLPVSREQVQESMKVLLRKGYTPVLQAVSGGLD